MTMNGHGVSDGEHDGALDEDLVAAGAGRQGLGRRHLLGGLVAGAAGLLLPGWGVSAQLIKLKRIRFEIFNREWGNNVVLESHWLRYVGAVGDSPLTWNKVEVTTLNEGQNTAYESPNSDDNAIRSSLRLYANEAGIAADNPTIGDPKVRFLWGPEAYKPLAIGESVSRRRPSYRAIKVTRKDDTNDFKVFVVELIVFGKEGPVRPVRGKQDKKDKNDNNDNTKRRRKRGGGGGGISDVDQREPPVERLLD